MFSFLIKPDSFDGHDLDVSLMDWMDVQDMEMQLIELKSSTLWVQKFAELRKQLETTAVHDHGACILTCWTSVPENRLTTDHSEACLQLKVTNYKPQIMELSQAKQGQGSH
ncbi:hypothetical protein ABVT39_009464 [Epinephelus coioides]